MPYNNTQPRLIKSVVKALAFLAVCSTLAFTAISNDNRSGIEYNTQSEIAK